jgi:Uma2 family endonuclease
VLHCTCSIIRLGLEHFTGGFMSADAAEYAPEERFTYGDYKSWELKPGERFELIDGIAYGMSAPNTRHQGIVTELTRQFANFLVGKPCKVFVAPFDVRLFYEGDDEDDTVVQPDLTVICDEAKRGPEGCRGAPDMVVEVLSPSNKAGMLLLKQEAYRRAGVKEFWVIEPEGKILFAYRLAEGRYVVTHFTGGETAASTVLPGLEIALEALFAE